MTTRAATGRRACGNLKDEAASYIRAAITSGDLPARSRIDQDVVAQALGISRAPVREALIELTQKGFVDAILRRGAFVAELTPADIEDYYEVVASVFGLTTRRAVSRAKSLKSWQAASPSSPTPGTRLGWPAGSARQSCLQVKKIGY